MGCWKNFEELEDSITIDELFALLNHTRKEDSENKKFQAALQGVDIEKGKPDSDFEAVRQRAMAKITGKTEEELTLAKIGIAIATD